MFFRKKKYFFAYMLADGTGVEGYRSGIMTTPWHQSVEETKALVDKYVIEQKDKSEKFTQCALIAFNRVT